MPPPTPNNLNSIKGDVYGGITAAVVALPLALAFGVASGVGPIAGLYGAIAVGFFAAVFGGTPSQVSGPTGPMTVLMAVIVANHADSLSQAFETVPGPGRRSRECGGDVCCHGDTRDGPP